MQIEVSNLKKSYDGKEILKDLSFKIEDISSIGIIGESGCGKSTLLRQLAGIERPDCGSIRIDGISPIEERKEFLRHIGYVFQQANLFPHLSVNQNICLILEKIEGMEKKKAQQTALQVLKQLRIENIKDLKPGQISGGQAQRASIARALSTDPSHLFLDEPTSALDPVMTEEVLQAILSLKQEGRNFIFITHEIAFLEKFADYIIFMKEGRICEAGDSSHIKSPKTIELKEFLQRH